MMKMMSFALPTLAAGFLVATAACGGSDSTSVPVVGTTWSANATGGVTGSFSGISAAAVSSGLFTISLPSTSGNFALVFTRPGARVGTGTYTTSTTGSGNASGGFTAVLTNNGVLYGGTGGTLTITSSSTSEIKGNFDIQMKLASGTTTTNVTGSFTAACTTGC